MKLVQNEPSAVKDKIFIHFSSQTNALSISTTETRKFGVFLMTTEKQINRRTFQLHFVMYPLYTDVCVFILNVISEESCMG